MRWFIVNKLQFLLFFFSSLVHIYKFFIFSAWNVCPLIDLIFFCCCCCFFFYISIWSILSTFCYCFYVCFVTFRAAEILPLDANKILFYHFYFYICFLLLLDLLCLSLFFFVIQSLGSVLVSSMVCINYSSYFPIDC